jgi:hypothetical protein
MRVPIAACRMRTLELRKTVSAEQVAAVTTLIEPMRQQTRQERSKELLHWTQDGPIKQQRLYFNSRSISVRCDTCHPSGLILAGGKSPQE